MEFKFGILLIISFSSVLLISPPALCHLTPTATPTPTPTPTLAPAPSPIQVSYISEAPAYIPDADAPVSYISNVPASSPEASLSPNSSPATSPSSIVDFEVELAPNSSPGPSSTMESAELMVDQNRATDSDSLALAPTPSSTTELVVDKPSDTHTLDSVQLDTVKKVCGITENPELCAKSIIPYIKGVVNPMTALQTEIKTFIALAEKAIAKFKASADKPSTSSSTADCLKVCIEIYSSARDDLRQALDAIASKDMALLKSVLSGAITDLGTCEDTFSESADDELPLDNDLVSTMHKLADNCMDISAVLFV